MTWQTVQCVFRFRCGEAREVYLAGNFEEPAVRMRPAGEGTWEASLELEPGEYAYQYYVVRETGGRLPDEVQVELMNEGSVLRVPVPDVERN